MNLGPRKWQTNSTWPHFHYKHTDSKQTIMQIHDLAQRNWNYQVTGGEKVKQKWNLGDENLEINIHNEIENEVLGQ